MSLERVSPVDRILDKSLKLPSINGYCVVLDNNRWEGTSIKTNFRYRDEFVIVVLDALGKTVHNCSFFFLGSLPSSNV